MIKIVQLSKIENLNDYIVIIPSCCEVYYKKKYINKNVNLVTLRNFLTKLYDGYEKLATKNEKYVIMYEAVKFISNDLKIYNGITTASFINDLVKTYDFFSEYELVENDKVNDLKMIFDKYEKLLQSHGLINEKLLFEKVIDKNNFNDKYLFLNLSDIDKHTIRLIDKMDKDGEVLIATDSYNKSLEEKLKSIDASIKLENDTDLNEKSFNYKLLNDVSDEVSFVNNDIAKKIMEGSNYSDFLIVSNEIDKYYPYFNLMFNFPYNKKEKTGILTNQFISLFLNILKGNFTCENFINILKLDLFNVDIKMIDRLDNYIYSWDLYDTNFYLPFTLNPSGNKKELNENDKEVLKKLNEVKNSVIVPIKYLLENIVGNATKTEILKNIYMYLSEEEIINKLFIKDEEGTLELVSTFDTLNDYLKDDRKLDDIITILLGLDFSKNEKCGTQDEVTISNFNDAVLDDKKFIYIIGAVEGSVPSEFSIKGLLNENDIEKNYLIKLVNDNINTEQYLFEKMLKNKNITITCHKLGLDLKLKNPSSYLSSLNLKEINHDKLYDKNLIINNYGILLSDDKINKIQDDEFNKINRSKEHNLNYKITNQNARLLYKNMINLSPSSIETYSKCPFLYFCEKGLKLKVKEKYFFDSREVGTFVHYMLEKIIKNNFNDITMDNLDAFILKYAQNYLEDNGKEVNNVSKYLIKKLSENVSLVIKNIVSEKEVSDFIPKYFEFKINDESVVKPISINVDNNTLKVSGIADRVDVCEDDENYYYRIIDYKTGEKKFRLDDVLMGLNLQMLLYILAIKESTGLTNKTIVPAGILYYPAYVKETSASRSISEEEKTSLVKDRLKMSGIINKDDKVINHLGNDMLGNYISALTRGKLNEDYLFDLDDLDKVFKSIKNTLIKIGNEINSGNVNANPIGGRINACAYCKFKDVCKFDSNVDKARKPLDYKNSEVLKMLEGDLNA